MPKNKKIKLTKKVENKLGKFGNGNKLLLQITHSLSLCKCNQITIVYPKKKELNTET